MRNRALTAFLQAEGLKLSQGDPCVFRAIVDGEAEATLFVDVGDVGEFILQQPTARFPIKDTVDTIYYILHRMSYLRRDKHTYIPRHHRNYLRCNENQRSPSVDKGNSNIKEGWPLDAV